MQYNVKEIADILSAKILFSGAEKVIEKLAFDSRSLPGAEDTLFFAIKGDNHDGHRHLTECYKKGVHNFVIQDEKLWPQEITEGVTVLLVEDTVEAMQRLAAEHRNRFEIPIIGITGSNGKTVIKEWLYELLRADKNVVRSPKSYNSQIGVPLSVWQIRPNHELGIFEAGISKTAEMQKLEEIIRPSLGLFTNIGEAHQANFTSVEQKIEEKLELFRNTEKLIYCNEHSILNKVIQRKLEGDFFKKDIKLISWGNNDKATKKVSSSTRNGKAFLNIENQEIELPFSDRASVENLTHCCVIMTQLGYSIEQLQERIKQLHPIEMRLEIKDGVNGCTVINDSYNSDLLSLSIALDTLNQQSQHTKKAVILSDILESGKSEADLYREVANLIRLKGVKRFIGIGEAISRNASFFDAKAEFYETTEAFLQSLDSNAFENEAILIKGSRAFGFERIARRLQQKSHTTVLKINLNAIVHNLNVYRGILKPNTMVMAMVKAFSYGSGAYEIANILQFHKIDYLAVAYADEGVYLRKHGITVPILVMNVEENAFESMIEHRLEPELYSFKVLRQFSEAVGRFAMSSEPFPVHIKIDTGMHRLGFMPEDVPQLIEELKQAKDISIASVFSHMASADVPEHDEWSKEQIREFDKLSKQVESAVGYPVLKHILNSSGIVRFPEGQFDMVRLGLGLYGYDPAQEIQSKLEPVSSLITHISQLKTLEAGEAVGYSRKGMVNKPTTIAITGLGYADGFPRALGNGVGEMLVKGKRARVIGNVCMDMTMIDVTGMDVQEGDEVVVFGENIPVEEMAEKLSTIPYEILTNVSQRVKRIYYKE